MWDRARAKCTSFFFVTRLFSCLMCQNVIVLKLDQEAYHEFVRYRKNG
jgi:hypothetical protein